MNLPVGVRGFQLRRHKFLFGLEGKSDKFVTNGGKL